MRIFDSADFLLPDEQYFSTWPVIACDQFTSEKAYWERVETRVGDQPSSLRLIYPEVYLSDHMEERIDRINQEMHRVLSSGIMHPLHECFVYVE